MDIIRQAREWVGKNYTSDKHLLRAEYWLKKLKPDADEVMIGAAISHDIERAFLENRKPPVEDSDNWDDRKYSLWHGRRSAKFTGEFLKKLGIESKLVSRVKYLIVWHELGGDKDRNLIKDADSVSFFENNIPFFLNRKSGLENYTKRKVSRTNLRKKFDYMFNRISSKRARKFALPFYQKALKDLEKY